MWLMLQQDSPDDYVIASGCSHSVREFLEKVFSLLQLDWRECVKIDPYYFRPTEVDFLLGDPSKAKSKLNWSPKTSFEDLVRLMIEHDLDLAHREAHAFKFRQA
jgi:GDPmannose 4,6-dehydratase